MYSIKQQIELVNTWKIERFGSLNNKTDVETITIITVSDLNSHKYKGIKRPINKFLYCCALDLISTILYY